MAGSSFPSLKRLSLSMCARGSLGLGSLGVPSTRAQRPTVLPQPTMVCRTHVCSYQTQWYEQREEKGQQQGVGGVVVLLVQLLPAAWLHGGQCSRGAAHPHPRSPPPQWRHWGPAVERNVYPKPSGPRRNPNPNPNPFIEPKNRQGGGDLLGATQGQCKAEPSTGSSEVLGTNPPVPTAWPTTYHCRRGHLSCWVDINVSWKQKRRSGGDDPKPYLVQWGQGLGLHL